MKHPNHTGWPTDDVLGASPITPETRGALPVRLTADNDTWSGTDQAEIVHGFGGDDRLSGNGGNDILFGDAGNDTLDGGLGNDSYVVESPGDMVIELADQGHDRVYASVSFTAPANVEDVILTGSSSLSASGNGLDNIVRGNAGDNSLNGLAGNDALYGGEGNDALTGGLGRDYFVFELNSGNDIIIDFHAYVDVINLHAYSHGVTYDGVTITQTGFDTVIDLGDGNSVTVMNTAATSGLLDRIVW